MGVASTVWEGLTAARVFWLIAVSWLVFVTGFVGHFALASRRPRSFPPGPSTLPLLGNIHQFPKTKGFLRFHEWGKEYGSIIGLKLGPQNIIVLNDYNHVQELFDKKGSIYSDRPSSHIANDLIYQDKTHILFLPYGEDWKLLRKTLQGLLNVKAVDSLLPIQEAEAQQTVFQLLNTPEDWYDHIRRYSSAVILASVFGLRGDSFESPRVKALYHVQDQMTAIMEVGATPPIDVFPFLKYLPDFLAPWRTRALSVRKGQRKLYYRLMEESIAQTQKQKDKGLDCFLNRLIQDKEKNGLDDEHIAYLGGTLMEGGSDTTSSTLLSFLLAMVQHPHVLKKCQEEVDTLYGSERFPSIKDTESLSYLRAVMNEVCLLALSWSLLAQSATNTDLWTSTLRWRPVAAGGVPHALTEDDHYNGYYLPKGTLIFANAWSIHRTDEFSEPEAFVPERFLTNKFGITSNDSDGNSNNDKRRVIYGFGAGRRVCSGQRLAENSLMVSMAKLVWAFDMKADGPIDDSVDTGYFGGFLVAPKKFPMRLTARSAAHAQVVRDEFVGASEYLARFE